MSRPFDWSQNFGRGTPGWRDIRKFRPKSHLDAKPGTGRRGRGKKKIFFFLKHSDLELPKYDSFIKLRGIVWL